MTDEQNQSTSELERMALALENQNRLLESEQELRKQELKAQREVAQATLLDSQTREREIKAAEQSVKQTEQLLASCQSLQALVRDLLGKVDEALDHGEVADLIRQLGNDIQVLVGLMGRLSLGVSAIVSDGASEEHRQELQALQNRIMDILQQSVGHDITAIGQVSSKRDTNIKGG